jgi:hypothetical protein
VGSSDVVPVNVRPVVPHNDGAEDAAPSSGKIGQRRLIAGPGTTKQRVDDAALAVNKR